jgi:hypothetical protein
MRELYRGNPKVVVKMLEANENSGGSRSILEASREKTHSDRQAREREAREHPITKHVLQTFGASIKEIKTDV